MLTHADGSYRFSNVPRGAHRIAAVYRSHEPFFFTTSADLEVEENATINFGIAYSLSGLTGHVLNDAGQGIPGVTVIVGNKGLEWRAVTEADGSFFVSSLVAGEYSARVDADSLPPGYSAEALVELPSVPVEVSSPGRAAFTARALRSISGQVLRYDTVEGRYVPVVHERVLLGEPGITAATDAMGRYLFRDLAAGSYTMAVQNHDETPVRRVRLAAPPVVLENVDFHIGSPLSP